MVDHEQDAAESNAWASVRALVYGQALAIAHLAKHIVWIPAGWPVCLLKKTHGRDGLIRCMLSFQRGWPARRFDGKTCTQDFNRAIMHEAREDRMSSSFAPGVALGASHPGNTEASLWLWFRKAMR